MLFAVGTLWFWLLLTAVVIAMIAFIEKEEQSGTGATILLIGFLVFTGVFGGKEDYLSAGSWIIDNPFTIIGVFLGYLLLGVVWSFVKWYLFLNDLRAKCKENGNKVYAEQISFWRNKSRILVWMSYWPFSAVWFVVHDPIVRSFKFLQTKLAATYQKISDKMFKDLIK
jgi:hypothetical protein